jgi:hypothetical protein
VHRVFSDTETFRSEMPRGAGWEQFNKVMFAQFVTQMDGEQHARVRRRSDVARSSARALKIQSFNLCALAGVCAAASRPSGHEQQEADRLELTRLVSLARRL